MRIAPRAEKKQKDFSGAMTDLSFLLIIFFILSAVFISYRGVVWSLPEPGRPPVVFDADDIAKLEVLPEGVCVLDGDEYGLQDLGRVLKPAATRLDDPVILLTVYDGVVYQYVLDVIEIARESGFERFSLKVDSSPETVQ